MTDPNDKNASSGEEETESVRVRALVKRALGRGTLETPDILRGVQRRIRHRSRGKFFADGWSTMQTRLGYLLVAAITLLLVALAYCALGPMDVR